MKEISDINLFENWLAPIEDLRDKISFQLHELFSFYEGVDGLWEDENQTCLN
jgi:hypothetical protein